MTTNTFTKRRFGYMTTSNLRIAGISLRADCTTWCATLSSAEDSYRMFSDIAVKSGMKITNCHEEITNILHNVPDANYVAVYSKWFGLVQREVEIETWFLT